MEFKELPIEVQEEVKSSLCAYDECYVWKHKEDDTYKVMECIVVARNNPYKVVARIHKDEVFTKEEQILNYVNTFRDYPIEYKGIRNSKDIEKLSKRDVETVDNRVKVTYFYKAVYNETNDIEVVREDVVEYV